MLEHMLEKQKCRRKLTNRKIVPNVDNNMLERENKILNKCNGSNNSSEYILKNTVGNGRMKHRFKLKRNNIESKHTTSYISRNNVDNITENSTDSKNQEKNSTDYNSNTHTATHEIAKIPRQHESSHMSHPINKNKVHDDIKKHEFDRSHTINESMYTSNNIASDISCITPRSPQNMKLISSTDHETSTHSNTNSPSRHIVHNHNDNTSQSTLFNIRHSKTLPLNIRKKKL